MQHQPQGDSSSANAAPHVSVLVACTIERMKCLDYAGAVRAATEALEAHPGHVSATLLRATARTMLGDPQGALQDVSDALAGQPGSVAALSARVLAMHRLGNVQGAQQTATDVLAACPDATDMREIRAFTRLKLGDHAGAIEDATDVLAACPDATGMRELRAVMRLKLGDHAGAMEDATHVLAACPDATDVATRQLREDMQHVCEDALRMLGDHNDGMAEEAGRVAVRKPVAERRRQARIQVRWAMGRRVAAARDVCKLPDTIAAAYVENVDGIRAAFAELRERYPCGPRPPCAGCGLRLASGIGGIGGIGGVGDGGYCGACMQAGAKVWLCGERCRRAFWACHRAECAHTVCKAIQWRR